MKQTWFLISAFLGLIPGIAKAQSILVGVKSGVNVSHVEGDFEQTKESSSMAGFYSGVVISIKFNEFWSLQGEVNYLPQGYQRNGFQLIKSDEFKGLSAGTKLYGSFNSKTILNYMEIPVLARVNVGLGKQFSYYLLCGPYISILQKAQTATSGYSHIYLDQDGKFPLTLQDGNVMSPVSFDLKKNIRKEIKTINAGAVGGLGLSYLAGRNQIFVEARITSGYTNIYKNNDIPENYTGSVIAAIGYMYRL